MNSKKNSRSVPAAEASSTPVRSRYTGPPPKGWPEPRPPVPEWLRKILDGETYNEVRANVVGFDLDGDLEDHVKADLDRYDDPPPKTKKAYQRATNKTYDPPSKTSYEDVEVVSETLDKLSMCRRELLDCLEYSPGEFTPGFLYQEFKRTLDETGKLTRKDVEDYINLQAVKFLFKKKDVLLALLSPSFPMHGDLVLLFAWTSLHLTFVTSDVIDPSNVWKIASYACQLDSVFIKPSDEKENQCPEMILDIFSELSRTGFFFDPPEGACQKKYHLKKRRQERNQQKYDEVYGDSKEEDEIDDDGMIVIDTDFGPADFLDLVYEALVGRLDTKLLDAFLKTAVFGPRFVERLMSFHEVRFAEAAGSKSMTSALMAVPVFARLLMRTDGARFARFSEAFKVDLLAKVFMLVERYGERAMVKDATLLRVSDQLVDYFCEDHEKNARALDIKPCEGGLEVNFPEIVNSDQVPAFVKVTEQKLFPFKVGYSNERLSAKTFS
jgi:hypothetical protein